MKVPPPPAPPPGYAPRADRVPRPRTQFGRIVSVDLKSPAVPPPFAFVEFDHPRCGAAAVAWQVAVWAPGTVGLHELGTASHPLRTVGVAVLRSEQCLSGTACVLASALAPGTLGPQSCSKYLSAEHARLN